MPVYRMRLWTGGHRKLMAPFSLCAHSSLHGSILFIYVCLLLAAHWTHLLTLGTWKCVPTRQQEDGLYTGKALAVQSEQAEEAPFMECAQAVGSTLPGRPEQEFWGQTTWFEYWPTTTYGGNPDSL